MVFTLAIGFVLATLGSAHQFEDWAAVNPSGMVSANGYQLSWADAGERACRYRIMKNGVEITRSEALNWEDTNYSAGDTYRVEAVLCSDAEIFSHSLTVPAMAMTCDPGLGDLHAHPDVRGWGTNTTTHGRLGETYIVTNLNDSGAGSLRDAVEGGSPATPRIVIFNVAGRIVLNSRLEPRSNLGVFGHVAPAQGIEVYISDTANFTHIMRIRANNTFWQHLSFIGDPIYDTISVSGEFNSADNHVFWHNTIIGSNDELFQLWRDFRFITIARNMFANPFPGASSNGPIFDASSRTTDATGNVSFTQNLISSASARTPFISGMTNGDMRNNWIYNHGNWGMRTRTDGNNQRINIVNNYFVDGPDSGSNPIGGDIETRISGGGSISMYVDGNLHADTGTINRTGTFNNTWNSIAEIATPTMGTMLASEVPGFLAPIVGHSLPGRGTSDQVRVDGAISTNRARPTTLDHVARPTASSNPLLDMSQPDGIPLAWKNRCGLSGDLNSQAASGGWSWAEVWAYSGMPQN